MKTTLFKTLLGLFIVLNTSLALAQAWVPVGDTEFIYTDDPFLVIDSQDIPYLLYRNYWDNNRGIVVKFENDIWDHAGSPPFSHMIYPGYYNMIAAWGTHELAIDNNNIPYVAYRDLNGVICVRKLEDNTWHFVGGSPIVSGEYISLVIDENNIPHVAYSLYTNAYEEAGYHIAVIKYEDSIWQLVGDPIFVHEMYESDHNSLLFDNNNNLYLAYLTSNYITGPYNLNIKKFESGVWVEMINPETASEFFDYEFKVDSQNTLYIAYTDEENKNIIVKKFEDNSWQIVGEIESEGDNHRTPSLAINHNDIPFVSYAIEIHDPISWTAAVKKFENGNWQNVGNVSDYLIVESITFDSNNMLFGIFIEPKLELNTIGATVKKFDPTASVEVSVFDEVKMYPNPTSGLLYIETSQEIQSYEVYNLIGQRLLSGSSTDSIDMREVSKGTYIIRLTTPNGEVFTEKVIKE